MTLTQTDRIRIEVLLDAPLLDWLIGKIKACGITGHTVFPTLSGEGVSGHWHDDQITSAQQKIMVLIITDEEKAEELGEQLRPLLDSYGIVLLVSRVAVLRAHKFP